MTEPNRELRIKLIATMEEYQLRHALRSIILDAAPDLLDVIDQLIVDAIDADPPEPSKGKAQAVINQYVKLGDELRDAPFPPHMKANLTDSRDTFSACEQTLLRARSLIRGTTQIGDWKESTIAEDTERLDRLIDAYRNPVPA